MSCSSLASSLLVGGFLGVTVSFATGFSFYLVVPGVAVSASVLVQGFCLLWKLRQSLIKIVKELILSVSLETSFVSFLFLSTLLTAFSNSFVILGAQTYNFLTVSLAISFLVSYRNKAERKIPCLAILLTIGFLRLSTIYVRCR